jgi:hypothetical protein
VRGQGVISGAEYAFRFGKRFTALAAILASISTPSLAQQPDATRLEGPVAAAQGRGGAAALGTLVLDRAAACGMDADALTVRQERTSVEPATPEAEAALDERVEAISARSGFTGPKDSRQASRAAIRAMLTERLLLTLAYTGPDAETGMACLTGRMAEDGFTPADRPAAVFRQADADTISDTCKAPRAWLIVEPGGAVRFEPPMEADYQASACILEQIKASGVTKFGFVGNEKYVTE